MCVKEKEGRRGGERRRRKREKRGEERERKKKGREKGEKKRREEGRGEREKEENTTAFSLDSNTILEAIFTFFAPAAHKKQNKNAGDFAKWRPTKGAPRAPAKG